MQDFIQELIIIDTCCIVGMMMTITPELERFAGNGTRVINNGHIEDSSNTEYQWCLYRVENF
jgi:hypothetical protein